jgi:hypothetical protein
MTAGTPEMTKLQRIIAQWMADHPGNKPYPRDPDSQMAWRRARGLAPDPKAEAKMAEYLAIMAAKRGA